MSGQLLLKAVGSVLIGDVFDPLNKDSSCRLYGSSLAGLCFGRQPVQLPCLKLGSNSVQ